MPDSPVGAEDAEATYRSLRLVLDLPESVVQLLSQVAEYRNALAAAEGRRYPRGAWSRKSLAEHVLRRTATELLKEVAPTVEAFGPFPEIDLEAAGEKEERRRFREAMAKYVRRVLSGKKK